MKPTVLVGEAWGEQESKTGTPFCGASGIELLRLLDEARVIELTAIDTDYIRKYWQTSDPFLIDAVWGLHPEVYRTNVFQRHPPGNRIENFCGAKNEAITGYPAMTKNKYCHRDYIHELERLGDELVEQDPNLIVALGNIALWALCGSTGISKVRGTTRTTTHTASGFKLLPTYHPSAVLRQWELRPVALIDLMKAAREREFPEIRRPKREIWIEPTLDDLEEFYERHIAGCEILSVDIETSGNQVTIVGFSPDPLHSLVVPFVDDRKKGKSYWPTAKEEATAWYFVQRILADRQIKKVFQNGLYDIAFDWRSMGLPTYGAEHDTMLLHHALQPESLKSLGFMGSIYTDEGAWKKDRLGTTTIKRDE